MKLKYQFVFQPVGNAYVATAVGDDAQIFNGMLQLNQTGYDIVQLVGQGLDHDQIVDKMCEEYDAPRGQIESAVDSIIAQLRQEDILID